VSDADRVMAGSTYKNGWLWTFLVVGVLLTGMDLIWGREWGTSGSLAVIGGIALFLAFTVWTALFFKRRWLKVEPDRFHLDGPGFHQTWRDLEVEALCWSVKKNYVNGLPSSESYRLEVVDAKGRRGLMRHTRPLEKTSPFLEFANRLFEGLSVRMREQIARGMELKGEGWWLGRETLRFKDGEIRVAEVSGVGEFDHQLRVWKKGSNDAAFGIPAGSLNATLLRRLLDMPKSSRPLWPGLRLLLSSGAALYPDERHFRSHVVMARHGFGKGEYRYFKYPLPTLIGELRTALYPRLAGVANSWSERMGIEGHYPDDHASFLAQCHAAGQMRPTPLLLHYVAGDFNCLHQDLYGDIAFPIQVAILLSEPGTDFTGGEFVLTEQRPRMQSRADVIPLAQGDAVAFAVHHRPVKGTRGTYRVNMRHGVSRLRSGERHTLGIIFHDAK